MKRFKESPVTTIFGMLILIALLVLVYLKTISIEGASGFLVIAGALFFSDDKMFLQNFLNKIKKTDEANPS